MSITAEQMGIIIRDQRKSKNLTQLDLAQAAGVSVQAVSKWEVGQSLPDVTLLPDIADCLDLPLAALFGREEEKEDAPAPEARPAAGFFPEDGKLRVAQFLGSRVLREDEQKGDIPPIPLAIEEALKNGLTTDLLNRLNLRMEVLGAARIEGSVQGDVSAGGRVECTGDIQGDVHAGGSLACGSCIQGDASAGGSLACEGDIQGDARAGSSLACKGDIQGNASAGTSLTCEGGIEGDAESKGDLKCGGDIQGDASAGGSLTCGGDIEGSVHMNRKDGGAKKHAMRFSGSFDGKDRAELADKARGLVADVLKSVGIAITPNEPADEPADEPKEESAAPRDETPNGGN